MTGMPRLNALRPQLDGGAAARGDLDQRASDYRRNYEQSSEDAALADGGTASLVQTRINNLKSRAMAQNNPEWDALFQSIRDAGNGRPVKMVAGPSPEGSNQITGLGAQRSAGAAPVQGGPFGAPDTGPYGNQAPDRGPYGVSDSGPYGDQAPDRGPYNSMDALQGRVRSAGISRMRGA